jgi:hypothetical protein
MSTPSNTSLGGIHATATATATATAIACRADRFVREFSDALNAKGETGIDHDDARSFSSYDKQSAPADRRFS